MCIPVSADLPVPVAEGQGHHEALERVQEEVCVLIDGHEVTAAGVDPVEGDQPLEPEEGHQDRAGSDGGPEVGRLVSVRSPQLGDQDVEDVDEGEDVAGDAEEARKVGEPLQPDVGRGLGLAHHVLLVEPHQAVHQGRQDGNSWQETEL